MDDQQQQTIIEWRSVSHSFGKVKALDQLSLRIKQGELFGFLGPNGAGKTTALRIAVGLVRPNQGETFFNGTPSQRSESRRSMVYLPEEIRFSGAFRLGEWIRHQIGLRGGEKMGALEALDRLGLSSRIDSPVKGFSKGMKRRAALALIVACRPSIWILDEPTADLDVQGREMVENLLLDAKREGATIFLSSHILSDVERVCDRVGVIDKGRLIRTAEPAEMIPQPYLVDLTLQSKSERGEAELLAGGRPHFLSPEGRRIRIFVADRAEGESVTREMEERGVAVAQSTFRPASLRDAIGSILP